MQVTGMGGGALGYQYTGALSAFSSIIKNEGFLGLYQGIWPNLCMSDPIASTITFLTNPVPFSVKVAPSIATSFFTYELVKELLV
jgi:solute carrier family 25 (mitochondrial phosphate transporter), member 23/24/25/41